MPITPSLTEIQKKIEIFSYNPCDTNAATLFCGFLWWLKHGINPGLEIGYFEKNSRWKKLKTQEKKLNNSRKKLEVLANFDYQVTK